MLSKKSFVNMTSIVVAVAIISALILLIINKLYLAKSPFDRSSGVDPIVEGLDPSEYRSIINRGQKAADSLQYKFQGQQRALSSW